MRLGKLDNDALERLILQKFVKTRPESLGSPRIGLDCATIDLSGDLAVLSCDPITSAGIAHLGHLSVNVSCNDAASAGAEPIGLLITLLVPPNGNEAEIDCIANDIADAATIAGVDILGGHTEVTDAVTRYVTCTSVLARIPRESALQGMQPGDDIVMTKYAGIEGTSIILSDYSARLPKDCPRQSPPADMISVVPESRIAMQYGAHAMHDVTEGGVLGALWEMSSLYGCGLSVQTDKIPVLSVTRAVCKALGLEPLRLIGSGSMLIACKDGSDLCCRLQEKGIPASVIAHAQGTGVLDEYDSKIASPAADEIYRLS